MEPLLWLATDNRWPQSNVCMSTPIVCVCVYGVCDLFYEFHDGETLQDVLVPEVCYQGLKERRRSGQELGGDRRHLHENVQDSHSHWLVTWEEERGAPSPHGNTVSVMHFLMVVMYFKNKCLWTSDMCV